MYISLWENSRGHPDNISFMQFSTKIDGFEQKDSQGFENSYNSYEQYPLEKFLIFTIYQNYTLALTFSLQKILNSHRWIQVGLWWNRFPLGLVSSLLALPHHSTPLTTKRLSAWWLLILSPSAARRGTHGCYRCSRTGERIIAWDTWINITKRIKMYENDKLMC